MSRASDLELEVEESRASVEETVEALKGKMNVGDLVGEATRFLGDNGGGEILETLGRQVRANPLPVALVGIGVLWLMSGLGSPGLPGRNGRARRTHRIDYERGTLDDDEYRRTFGEAVLTGASHPDHAAQARRRGLWSGNAHEHDEPMREAMSKNRDFDGDDAAERVDEIRDRSRGVASRVGEAVSGAAESVAYGVGHAASAAAETVSHLASGAGDRAYAAAGYGVDAAWRGGGRAYRGASHVSRDAYRGASRSASYAGRKARRTLTDVLDTEPLVVAALGVAVGAAIGALLPRTDVEDRYFGETRDRFREDAEAYARDMYEQGKAVAAETYRAARDEADAQGLTSVSDFAENVVDRVGDVARAAVDQAKESASERGLFSGDGEDNDGGKNEARQG